MARHMLVSEINIARRHRQYNDDVPEEVKNWSLEDYRNIAMRCISYFADKTLATKMLRSEDAISFVTEAILHGAYNYDDSRGAKIKTYLNYCAKWSIKNWSIRLANYEPLAALDSSMSTSLTPLDIVSKQDEVEVAISRLTDRQKQILMSIYFENHKVADVAKIFGITKNAVYEIIKRVQKQNDGCSQN